MEDSSNEAHQGPNPGYLVPPEAHFFDTGLFDHNFTIFDDRFH